MKTIWKGLTALVLTLSLCLTMSGCSLAFLFLEDESSAPGPSSEPAPTVLSSADNQYSFQVPAGWKEDASLHEDSVLSVCSLEKNQYLVVIPEEKAYFSDDVTLEEYRDLILGNMQSSVEDFTASESSPLTFSCGRGLMTTITGVVDAFKVEYYVTTIDAADSFIQLCAWTYQASSDSDKQELKDVVTSFVYAPSQAPAV